MFSWRGQQLLDGARGNFAPNPQSRVRYQNKPNFALHQDYRVLKSPTFISWVLDSLVKELSWRASTKGLPAKMKHASAFSACLRTFHQSNAIGEQVTIVKVYLQYQSGSSSPIQFHLRMTLPCFPRYFGPGIAH